MASGDHGFAAPGLYGTADDNTYSGALSFLRRRYTRDLAGVDVVVSGIAYDLGTSNRPGSRFGPRGLRQASSHIAWARNGPSTSTRPTGWPSSTGATTTLPSATPTP